MNPSSLLPDSFAMEGSVTTDGDYISSHVTGFPIDEDDGSQRVGGLTSMPVNNGVRYHAQQPAMQDLHFPGSSALAMTPPDSCSDSFSPAPGPLFSHLNQHQHPFDRITDFRRVPALQPPPAMSMGMPASAHAVSSSPALMGRNNTYPSSYSLHRSMGLPLSGVSDASRGHQYSSTPQALDSILDRSPSTLFQQPTIESTQRPPAHVEVPPFEETEVKRSIVVDFGNSQQTVKPEVHAKITKGFFSSDGKWTCYRRNYFAVACSFSLLPWPSTNHLYIRHSDGTLVPIRGFAMGISAIVNGQYGDTRELVQHTPKRDKQSERKPSKKVLQPSPPSSLASGSTGPGGHTGYALGSQPVDYNSSFTAGTQPSQQPPTSHTFERIQFQRATANNGKRRAQQQYYNLVVELHAEIVNPANGESQWIQIAHRHSHPMVVRGRSPGHYKDGRRDSTASMGQDGVVRSRSTGHCKDDWYGSMGPDSGSGDGTGGALHHGLGQAARSHLLMYDTGHRGGLPYGRTDYRQMGKTEHSPLSDSPLISSSSSSGFDYSMVNDTMDPMDTFKAESTLDPYQDPVFAGVSNHPRPNSGGYDPVYSTYGRYDPIQNPNSLCT